MALTLHGMAARAARELKDGEFVNLEIGPPIPVPNCVPEGIAVTPQSEDSCVAVGPYPTEDEVDLDPTNAGKRASPLTPTHRSVSRYELRHDSQRQDFTGRSKLQAGLSRRQLSKLWYQEIGPGAMDLVYGAGRVVVVEHVAKDGSGKIVSTCSLPLNRAKVVDRIITDPCVIDVTKLGLELLELVPNGNVQQVLSASKDAPATIFARMQSSFEAKESRVGRVDR